MDNRKGLSTYGGQDRFIESLENLQALGSSLRRTHEQTPYGADGQQ